MSKNASRSLPPIRTVEGPARETLYVTVLAALCVLVLFAFLGDRPIWDIDEGKHAATSKDMVLYGDWVTPQFNGENFYDKTPLFNWLVAASFRIFGFTEFAARLPAAVLGLGCVMLTYGLGRVMFRPAVGFLGGVVLATSPEFVVLSRVVVHDIALSFCITSALLLFYMAYDDPDRRRSLLLPAWAMAGFGVLAKGPIGLLLPAGVIGLFLLMRGDLGFVRHLRIGWGTVVFLAVAAPWYVLVSLKNPDYAGYFFIQQNLNNFIAGQEARHPEPFYYYVPVLLGGFFPWSFFLPSALVHAARNRCPQVLFLLIWVGVIFFFFSAASSKLSTYILPLFPAAALLVAMAWHDLIQRSSKRTPFGFTLAVSLMSALLVAGVVYCLLYPPVQLNVKYGIDLGLINRLALWMGAWGMAVLLCFLSRRYRISFACLAGLVASSLIFFILLVVPAVNPYRSAMQLGMELDRILPPGERLVTYKSLPDSLLFYTDRRGFMMTDPFVFRDYFFSGHQVFCIIEQRYLDELAAIPRLKDVFETVYEWRKIGNKLLISNRPPV